MYICYVYCNSVNLSLLLILMATVTGIYWSLVLTGCMSLALSTVVLFQQKVPNPGIVPCPGDRVELECITNAGTEIATVFLRINDGGAAQLTNESRIHLQGSYTFNVTKVEATMSGNIMSSIATTDEPVDGTILSCAGADLMLVSLRINVSGPPLSVNNITIDPINNSTIFINWIVQEHVDHYNVTIISNNRNTESLTTNDTNKTINPLIIGTNYSFIIIPVDMCGSEGPPSSLIQYIWNVPAQVVNISWDQISTDSMTIWWSNTQDYTIIPVPPTQYYIISVYNTSNSIIYNNNTTNTNTTITGISLTDTNYTVAIIPVNIIGYGPSATITITGTVIMQISSTSIVMVTKTSSTDSSYTMSPISTHSSTTNEPTITVIPIKPSSHLNIVPVISTATGGIILIIIIIIIIIIISTLIVLKCKKQRSKDNEVPKNIDAATPTYDEIIVKAATVPIYDTPMELQANTAYDRPVINKDMIDVHNNAAYGQITT
ncbi:PREDICTED: uncharacterized protein LOC109584327 [Amphimedon queenslandica]|uniref:Fibronectin type-III domain-containing protein n=1 Tax=Amphimedon queenslandica TaxID=400682 RepID=A0AAN0JG15_AMPQE|nr:PREDICTED: uncharacterized protein LOC109584327 [Amphimedon queenslandica]|eukprot:XP_019855583.1 PREDICTED: uncharacterized protein LOC109584327 [Amphimedon queenslandica]